MITEPNPDNHYAWGQGCDSWNLLADENLSVKQEYMPPLTRETLHYHHRALQYFYILSGTAYFKVDDEEFTVKAGQGIKIAPGSRHYVENRDTHGLEFLVVSQPPTTNDRIEAD